MKKVLCLFVALLFIGSISFAEEIKPWYSYGLPSNLPSPSDVIGREIESSLDNVITDEDFYDELIGVTQEDFQKYVDYLVSIGFTIKATKTPDTFDASNDKGIWIAIIWYEEDNHMTVDATLMS